LSLGSKEKQDYVLCGVRAFLLVFGLKGSRVRTAVKGLLYQQKSEFQLGFLFIALFIQEENYSVRFGFHLFSLVDVDAAAASSAHQNQHKIPATLANQPIQTELELITS
jgi:hypothetical protein